MQYAHRDLVGRDPSERADDRLDRALHVALDDDRQFLGRAGRDFREHLFERAAPAGRRRRVAPAALAEIGDLARPRLVLDNDEIVAGERQAVEPEHLDRRRGTGLFLVLAALVDQRADPSPFAAGDENVADIQRAALHQNRRDRAAAAVELGFEDDALGGALRVRLQVEQFGLQQDRFLQLVEIGLLQRRHLDVEHLAAEFLDDDLVLQQFLADPVGSGVGPVHLVDRDDDRNIGRLRVADRLDGLLHDAVIGGDDQHDDVGDIGAARTHRGKGLMARRVDERDLLAVGERHAVGADMLRDAAGLAAGHVGLAQRVEQRGLAVIDMPHDRDDRGARLQHVGLVGLAAHADLDIGLGDAAHAVAELGDDQLGRVGVDRLVDRRHDAHAHQRLDHVGAALGHAVGEFLDRDRLGDDDVAHDLRLLAAQHPLALALAGAADRGEAAGALAAILVEGARDGQLAAAALVVGAPHRGGRALQVRAAAGPRRSRRFLFLLQRPAPPSCRRR